MDLRGWAFQSRSMRVLRARATIRCHPGGHQPQLRAGPGHLRACRRRMRRRFVVVAYAKLREHEPEAATTGLRAVRDLADVVLVCVKAVEGVVAVLSRPTSPTIRTDSRRWGYGSEYGTSYDLEDEPL